jgi:predicted RNase H-like HicB family nuclease
MDYIAYLHKDRDSDFGVSFPDFPGCITADKTLEEAHRMAAEALALHIAGMVEDGDAIPKPSTLDALAEDPAREGAVAFFVRVEPETERAVRINITGTGKTGRGNRQAGERSGPDAVGLHGAAGAQPLSAGAGKPSRPRETCEQEQRAVTPLVNQRTRSMSLAGCWR